MYLESRTACRRNELLAQYDAYVCEDGSTALFRFKTRLNPIGMQTSHAALSTGLEVDIITYRLSANLITRDPLYRRTLDKRHIHSSLQQAPMPSRHSSLQLPTLENCNGAIAMSLHQCHIITICSSYLQSPSCM